VKYKVLTPPAVVAFSDAFTRALLTTCANVDDFMIAPVDADVVAAAEMSTNGPKPTEPWMVYVNALVVVLLKFTVTTLTGLANPTVAVAPVEVDNVDE